MTGDVALGGSLDVSLLDISTLDPDTWFEIIDIAGSLTGEFAGLGEGAPVGNFGQNLLITYVAGDGNDVALYTLAAIAGDFDQDSDVDGADFLAWRRNPSVGDLTDWQTNFGHTSPSAIAAVPEPASLAVVALLFTVTAAARSRR